MRRARPANDQNGSQKAERYDWSLANHHSLPSNLRLNSAFFNLVALFYRFSILLDKKRPVECHSESTNLKTEFSPEICKFPQLRTLNTLFISAASYFMISWQNKFPVVSSRWSTDKRVRDSLWNKVCSFDLCFCPLESSVAAGSR
ncbi:hypothetical protein T01_12763 [Trichinella spiralis]|uniref:Uncharacterized protein n=1 Tax=Trichinella spiralis TaxID=6334 RepID=A0A0V1BYT3_TRISP|nr:hypothetical protein T01_12763 [Trichinella spiralis]